jgi:hypothetical protein
MDPQDLIAALLGGASADAAEPADPTPPTDEAIAAFWTAFSADEAALADEGVSMSALMGIHQRLQALSGALVPELGPADATGRLMLAVGVDGIAEYAPWAEAVVAAAPALARWSVRAFRPPKPLVEGEPCGPNPLTPDQVRFVAQPSDEAEGRVDLVVCLPDGVPEALHSTFGFQLLDAALGEKGVMLGCDAIDFGELADLEDWEVDTAALRPLTELPDAVRALGVAIEAPRVG